MAGHESQLEYRLQCFRVVHSLTACSAAADVMRTVGAHDNLDHAGHLHLPLQLHDAHIQPAASAELQLRARNPAQKLPECVDLSLQADALPLRLCEAGLQLLEFLL